MWMKTYRIKAIHYDNEAHNFQGDRRTYYFTIKGISYNQVQSKYSLNKYLKRKSNQYNGYYPVR